MSKDKSKQNEGEDKTRSASPSSDRPDLKVPRQLGQFYIQEEIGSGGMAAVFRAYDTSMRREVALKVLHPSLNLSVVGRQRFAREAWIAGRLSHPNIVEVYSRGGEEGVDFFAMELITGGSLADLIDLMRADEPKSGDTTEGISSERIRFIVKRFIGLCEALQHVHEKGFIHRDIKPHNILLSGSNATFKLTDFGIAHADDITKMTRAGDFIGTIKYMSPELLTAHRAKVDVRTDIYSLGITLYEAVSLKLPFRASTEQEFIGEILAGHAVPVRKFNKRVPRDLETVILKACHQDASRRYQTAREFADDLKCIIQNRPISAKREGPITAAVKFCKRQKAALVGTALSLAVAVLLFNQILSHKGRQSDLERIETTLLRIAEQGGSAYDINDQWARLSQLLRKELKENPVSRLSQLYHSASSKPVFTHLDYDLLSTARIKWRCDPVPLYNDWSERLSDSWKLSASLLEFALSVDNLQFRPAGMITDRYPGGGGCSLGDWILKLAPDVKAGRHQFVLQTVASHFIGAALYEDYESKDPQQTPIVTPGSDTLVMIDKSARGGSQSLLALDANLREVGATYVDTFSDTFHILLFDEYPEDFPNVISDSAAMPQVESSLSIDSMVIIKRSSDLYETILTGRMQPPPVPIAAEFTVASDIDSSVLLIGQLVYGRGIRLKYGGCTGGGGWFVARDSIVLSEGRSTNCLGLDSAAFSKLCSADKIRAHLRFTPSREVARHFGDIYEYWGHVINRQIDFVAVDSCQ
jgi:serine/threonine protein kinase